MMFIDTHCHLDFPAFDSDRDDVIKRAQAAGISNFINIGSSLAGSEQSLVLSRQYGCVFASIGLHPHEADNVTEETLQRLRTLTQEHKVVAIGEAGLDYCKQYSSIENQQRVFKHMIILAQERNLPLVIHTRDAQDDTLKIIKEHMPLQAVVHCFSGDKDFLEACLAEGFFVSFTCNITYRKSELLREIVKATPLSRIMLETDAPFLPPEGSRGKRNDPLALIPLAEEIARIKGVLKEEIARVTTSNAQQFFRLP